MDKQTIIRTAECMVVEHGLINLSRKGLCDEVGIADGSFPHIMGMSFTEFSQTLKGSDTKLHKVSKKRLSKDDRKNNLLSTALELAKESGYANVTRNLLAESAGVSMGLVSHYFGTMQQLKRALMRAAITREIPEIIAQGLSIGDENAKKAPAELKALAAKALVNM